MASELLYICASICEKKGEYLQSCFGFECSSCSGLFAVFPVFRLLCHVFLPSDGTGHHQLCLKAVFRICVSCKYTNMVHAFEIIHRPSRAHIYVYNFRYVVRMQWWHAHSSHCCFFSTRLFRLRCSCCWECHLAAARRAVARRPNGQQQGSLPGSGHGCSHRLGRRCVRASCTDNSGSKDIELSHCLF